MNIVKRMGLRLFKKAILKYLKENKEDIVSRINVKVDIPKLTEKQEEKYLNELYNLLISVIFVSKLSLVVKSPFLKYSIVSINLS